MNVSTHILSADLVEVSSNAYLNASHPGGTVAMTFRSQNGIGNIELTLHLSDLGMCHEIEHALSPVIAAHNEKRRSAAKSDDT